MNIDVQAEPISDEAVEREATRLIESAAAKHGISVDAVPQDAKDQALQYARQNLERAAAERVKAEAEADNVWKKAFEKEKQEREIAQAQLAAIRDQRQKAAYAGPKPEVVFQQAKARVGEHEWNFRFTESQKLAAVGIPPESVNLKEAQKTFGRGADPKLSIELKKSSPERYRTLKLAAIATGRYAA